MLKYHCFTYHIHSSFQISVSRSPKAALPQNFIFGIVLFFFFYCVEIQFYSHSKIDMYFTCSPLKAAAGLLALSPLVSSNTSPFSPSSFASQMARIWKPSARRLGRACCFISVCSCWHFSLHLCPESAPHSWDPAWEDTTCKVSPLRVVCKSELIKA